MARAPKNPEEPNSGTDSHPTPPSRRVTLKTLAQHLNLSTGTISIALNDVPAARGLRPETRRRIREAADRLGYRPNELARSLRSSQSKLIGILWPQIQSHYANGIVAGLEKFLPSCGYSYLASSHYNDPELAAEHARTLIERQVEGLVLIAVPSLASPPIPTVVIAGRSQPKVEPDISIDHDDAARRALAHLQEHGHKQIAFFQGNPKSSDSHDRWRAICEGADAFGIEIRQDRIRQLRDGASTRSRTPREGYEEGYALGRSLLDQKARFTALFAFNDLSAVGAIRAFLDAGLRVPEDISVIGFDDIYSSAFQKPSLTTLRQPLEEMGRIAGRVMMSDLGKTEDDEVIQRPQKVKAELVIRESTGPASNRSKHS